MSTSKDSFHDRNLICRLATKSRERGLRILESGYLVPCAFLVMAFFLSSKGYCDSDVKAIESLTNSTIETIFSPWVRKAALAFGAGFGLFQSYMGGSIKPLLSWGGLGLAVNNVPKIIDIISKVGS